MVAGAGGFFHLHYEQTIDGQLPEPGHHFGHENVTLDKYCDNRHGFLRLEITHSERDVPDRASSPGGLGTRHSSLTHSFSL